MEKLLWWLASKFGICLVKISPELVRAAYKTVQEVENIPGILSGDYKRCEALGRLIKRGPKGSKRDKAMAIEYVIRRGAV
jgi:hypothetical protein